MDVSILSTPRIHPFYSYRYYRREYMVYCKEQIMPEGYMSISEAAAAIGIAETTLRDRIRNGQVKAERIGKRVLVIPESEVERLRGLGRMRPGPKPRSAYAGRRQDEAEHDEALNEARQRIRGEASADEQA